MMLSSAHKYGSEAFSSERDDGAAGRGKANEDDDGFQEFQSAALKHQNNNFLVQRNQTFEEEQPSPQKEAATSPETRKGGASSYGIFKSLFRKKAKEKSPEKMMNGRGEKAADKKETSPLKKAKESPAKLRKESQAKKKKEAPGKAPQESPNKNHKESSAKK